MRIGIDARLAGQTGLGRYVTRLVQELAALRAPEEFVLFVGPDGRERFHGTGFACVEAPMRWYTLAEQVRLPRLIRQAKLSLFHAPHWNVPLLTPVPYVVTIHDLILLSHPSRRSSTLSPVRYALKSAGHRLVLRHAVRHAERIIAVSQATRQRLETYAPSASERITVIPEGGASLPPPNGSSPVSGMYVLYVGNAYPHKDVEGLLDAFALLRHRLPSENVRLVWVGQDDYFSQRVRHTAAWRSLAGAAQYLGPSDDASLSALYAGACCYVTLAREEGFGLPPLEAQAQGVPVVASDIPAHREVLADSASFVPIDDPSAAAAAMYEVLTNQTLRVQLLEKANIRRDAFSWKRMAEQTLALYRSCNKPSA